MELCTCSLCYLPFYQLFNNNTFDFISPFDILLFIFSSCVIGFILCKFGFTFMK